MTDQELLSNIAVLLPCVQELLRRQMEQMLPPKTVEFLIHEGKKRQTTVVVSPECLDRKCAPCGNGEDYLLVDMEILQLRHIFAGSTLPFIPNHKRK